LRNFQKREKKREKERNRKKGYKKGNKISTLLYFINIHSRTHTLRQIHDKLSSPTINLPTNNKVKVHICTQNRIFEATLALSSTRKQDKEITTAYSPFSFDEPIQTPCQTLNIPESLFNQEAMDSLQFPPKLAASSDSVHSSDGSLISVFNTEAVPSASSTYTNLEPSFDLSLGDPSFIQQILDSTDLTSSLSDIDLDNDIFPDFTDDSLLDFDPNTMIELSNIPMESSQQYSDHELTTTLPTVSTADETSISSVGSQPSDDSERDDINRRGLKKSGGPVRKLARFGNKQVIKYSEEYHDRRLKNNEAVKKSRMKAKDKQKTSEVQMNKLTEENRILNDRVDLLMKELQVLRSLYKELKQDSPVESVQALGRVNTH
jgi:hypothetical protein